MATLNRPNHYSMSPKFVVHYKRKNHQSENDNDNYNLYLSFTQSYVEEKVKDREGEKTMSQ